MISARTSKLKHYAGKLQRSTTVCWWKCVVWKLLTEAQFHAGFNAFVLEGWAQRTTWSQDDPEHWLITKVWNVCSKTWRKTAEWHVKNCTLCWNFASICLPHFNWTLAQTSNCRPVSSAWPQWGPTLVRMSVNCWTDTAGRCYPRHESPGLRPVPKIENQHAWCAFLYAGGPICLQYPTHQTAQLFYRLDGYHGPSKTLGCSHSTEGGLHWRTITLSRTSGILFCRYCVLCISFEMALILYEEYRLLSSPQCDPLNLLSIAWSMLLLRLLPRVWPHGTVLR